MIQMIARLFGLVFLVLGLSRLMPRRLRSRPRAGQQPAVDLALGGAGLASSRSWEGSRTYLIIGAATSAAIGLYGALGPKTDPRAPAPVSTLDRVVHLVLAFVMFQGWVANREDRDKTAFDSPAPPAAGLATWELKPGA